MLLKNWNHKLWTAECEECERASLSGEIRGCIECQQTLCSQCDKRIHNKGKRRFHVLLDCKDKLYRESFDKGLKVSYLSPETDPNYVKKRSHSGPHNPVIRETQKILLAETERGLPMVRMEEVVDGLKRKFPERTKKRLREVLETVCEQFQFFNFTKRKFGDSKQKTYLSLYLKQISLQAIIWILKSIKRDKMQPLHTLVHSRFKEYFGIKIGQKEWKVFVQKVYEESSKDHRGRRVSRKGSHVQTGPLPSYKKGHHKPGYKKSKYNKCYLNQLNLFAGILPELKLRKEDEDSMIWYFAKEAEWVYEDLSQVDTLNSDYKAFLGFIEDFFKNDEGTSGNSDDSGVESGSPNNIYQPPDKTRFSEKISRIETQEHQPTPAPPKASPNRLSQLKSLKGFKTRRTQDVKSKSQKSYGSLYKQPKSDLKRSKKVSGYSQWLSSVERPFQEEKHSVSGLEQSAEKLFQGKKVKKAIPGGKYGCALMVKHCGPEELQLKSLGRILALIKKSLEEGVLVHWKTLLVKNEKGKDCNSQAVEVALRRYQQNVLRLLSKHQDGISLAQFKQYYNKDYPTRPFEFEKLRFAKLTDFLNTMKAWVEIQKKLKNNNVVCLRKNVDVSAQITKINEELYEMGALNFETSMKEGGKEKEGEKKKKKNGMQQMFGPSRNYPVNLMHPPKIGPMENHIYQHQRAGAHLTADILSASFCKDIYSEY